MLAQTTFLAAWPSTDLIHRDKFRSAVRKSGSPDAYGSVPQIRVPFW